MIYSAKMLSASPLVTVVTPTLNSGCYLQKSVESVLRQDYPNIEYLVVDSNSTDDTPDILRKYAGRLRTIKTSRLGPASGIHTGLLQARGSILAWLNADDIYEPDAVRAAVASFQEHADADVVYGDACWIDEDDATIRPYPTIPFDASALERDCFICQPASFIRASAYRECPLDASLQVSFDYDLWIRLAIHGRHFQYLQKNLARSRMHRECLSLARRREVFEVSMGLLKQHYGYIPLPWVFGYLSYRRDGRDQFFKPLRYSPMVFAGSLAVGIAWNPTKALRMIREWTTTAGRGLKKELARLSTMLAVEPGIRPDPLPEPPLRKARPVAAKRQV